MGNGINRVILIGNLGADPELRHTPGGASVCNFSIATNESWTDKSGEKQERTEWHRIIVWGRMADACAKYLGKGRPVYVEGRLQTRKWDDKEGVTRYLTEIVAQHVQFLGGGNGSRRDDDAPPPSDDFGADDDIPFALALDQLDRLLCAYAPAGRAIKL
jgi:single-strand DNA-binding protein